MLLMMMIDDQKLTVTVTVGVVVMVMVKIVFMTVVIPNVLDYVLI
jgi:hypothetical protein